MQELQRSAHFETLLRIAEVQRLPRRGTFETVILLRREEHYRKDHVRQQNGSGAAYNCHSRASIALLPLLQSSP